MTPQQTERYKRHILLPEIGGQGQQALLSASVLVVGAGAIGCPALGYLAAAGIGRIGVCDGDVIELSNLQRQVIFRTEDIGRRKAGTAASRLSGLNPDVNWSVHDGYLTEANATALVRRYDLVIEGLDRYAPRYVVNKACLEAGKPLLSAAVGRFTGQVALFRPGMGDHPCYACLVPSAPDDEAACEREGVLGAITGVVGTVAAAEAVKHLCGMSGALDRQLRLYDGLMGSMRTVILRRDPACPVCGPKR
ncbi:HesA/MoeB/ThiF family protein [Parvularcula dongshanensis]|uniref:Adenylyltransferase/sulfurtransferase n=1 Tax=Parvularcula dongshanensis TaxID=1173995 RepID=A0A840I0N6_9PROT|nr:HesA/MoeB/ThiF family protein [Parvularcula dongshanensis]MBB4657895.1 adenylyltransferase/sulfurtransferase [Parvularcula dongshanensis]